MKNQSQIVKKYVNNINLAGVFSEEPTLACECYGEKFYNATLTCGRISGQNDYIPLLVSEKILPELINFKEANQAVYVTGEVRTHNTKNHHLIVNVFVKSIEKLSDEIDTTTNAVSFEGYICKPVCYRVTPFGREIADVLLAVNRLNSKTDYIPCIVWGRNAQFAKTLQVGDKIAVNGRFQSRYYEKKTEESSETKIAYEISVGQINKVENIEASVEATEE